jgi:proteasome lid subunit RPN8/RPN11
MKMVITEMARNMLEAAAMDCYGHESTGVLLGIEESAQIIVAAAQPIQRTDIRDENQIVATTAWELVTKHLDDYIVGGFHTHPDDRAYLSEGDRQDTDTYHHELVVPITYSTRKKRFCFPPSGWRAYQEDKNGNWRRIPIDFL